MSDTLLTIIAWVIIVRFILTVLVAIAKPDAIRKPMTNNQMAAGMVLAFLSVILAADVLGWIQ